MGTTQGGNIAAIENGPVRLTFGGLVFGFTMEGVDFDYDPTWNALNVDETGTESDADLMLAGQRLSVVARIPEFTFLKIRDLFPGSILSGSAPNEALQVGRAAGARGSSFAKALTIHPIALDLADLTRDVNVHKCLVKEGPGWTWEAAEALMREVTFGAIFDFSKADGNRLFSYGDPATGVDVTAPTISARLVSDTDTDVSKSSNLEWTMDEDMDPATINTDNVLLTEDGVGEVPSVVTYDGPTKKIILNPTGDMTGSAAHTAVLSTGVKDVAGNKLAAKDVINFTTIA